MEKLIKKIVGDIGEEDIDINDIKNQISKYTLESKVSYLRENINKPDILKKIRTYIINTGMEISIDRVQQEIMSNDLFAACFIKDTSKQNVYEKIQLSILRHYGLDIKKLPTNGKDRVFLNRGEITDVKPSMGKSIDFETHYNGKHIYVFAKFTKESYGGAQDNQAHDSKYFLQECKKYVNNHDDNVEFLFLGDGDYYQNTSFKNEIKEFICDRIKVFNINSIKSYLQGYSL